MWSLFCLVLVYISPYFLPFYWKIRFLSVCVLVFHVSIYLIFNFYLFFFYVLNSLSFLIMSDLTTIFNFLPNLFRSLFTNVDNFSQIHEYLFAENSKNPSKILLMLPFYIKTIGLSKKSFSGALKFKMSGTVWQNFENHLIVKYFNKGFLII